MPITLAADPGTLEAALEQPLLAPGQVLGEMRAFIEPRIIKMPQVSDRAAWEKTAGQLRRDMLEQIVFRGKADMWRKARCHTHWMDTVAGGPGYRIRKFRYEAMTGMWLPGLLYLPDKLEGNVPVAVNVNGHAAEGKAVNYKQLRSINLAKRGMLVLNLEWFGMGQLRTPGFAHGRMNQLDLCGASGLAPFYLALARGIDIAAGLEHADKDRIVVSGLSGGGWQTILISSLDERVALANPVAGYGSFRTNILFDDMGDSEQAPSDMGLVADYAHLTALRAPRPTLLTYNAGDECCFKSGHTLETLLAAARPVFALYGADDKLRSHVNHVPGTHNFEQENREKFYAAVADYFYPGDKDFNRSEIPSEAELKTAEELNVPLPDNNLDFHWLAMSLLPGVPADDSLPDDRAGAESWQRQSRDAIRSLLRVPNYEAVPRDEKGSEASELRVTSRVFTCGESWAVPAVEVVAKSAKRAKTVILAADGGRTSASDDVRRLVAEKYRVLAVDPTLFGEAKVKGQDPQYTYPLLMAAVGERALGVQAAQLAAIARWSKKLRPDEPVTLSAVGPRSAMAAIVATALEPAAIDGAEVTGALGSLKELIEDDKPVEELPELFAFGLLAEFDVRSLVALAAPRPVVFRAANQRAKNELGSLDAWYEVLGKSFTPLR